MTHPWDSVNDGSAVGIVNGQVGGDGAVAMPPMKPRTPPATVFDPASGKLVDISGGAHGAGAVSEAGVQAGAGGQGADGTDAEVVGSGTDDAIHPWDRVSSDTGGNQTGAEPPDDFADDPDYLHYRQTCGRIREFEEGRAQCRRDGFPPLTFAQYLHLDALRSVSLAALTPLAAADVLRRALVAMQSDDDGGRRFDTNVTPVSVFLARDENTTYLVEDALPAGQICLVGGPEKGQKSNLLVDLAVSLASGRSWLGRFKVTRPVKVLLLTGETQGANLQNIIRRVCKAKELAIADAIEGKVPVEGVGDRLVIKEALPSLEAVEDLATLGEIVRKEKAEVVILDPI